MSEIVTKLSYDQAREVTQQIRDSVENVWTLLKQAHDGKAWAALGHNSWEEYVRIEFQMSRRHANRLLSYAEVRERLGPIGPQRRERSEPTRRSARRAKAGEIGLRAV